MLYDLVVMFDFGGYKVGDRITNTSEISSILASSAAGLTRRVYHAEGTLPVPPAANGLPDETPVTFTIAGVVYPFTLAQLRVYIAGPGEGLPTWSLTDSYDFEVRRGQVGPAVIWVLTTSDGGPFPTDEQGFSLLIRWDGGSLLDETPLSASLVLNETASTLSWTPTPSQRLTLPLGRLSLYELRCRVGSDVAVIAAGFVTGLAA